MSQNQKTGMLNLPRYNKIVINSIHFQASMCQNAHVQQTYCVFSGNMIGKLPKQKFIITNVACKVVTHCKKQIPSAVLNKVDSINPILNAQIML